MATPEKAPAFQYYPKDYLADAKVRAMTYEERGIYWELVSHCWMEGTIPGDVMQLARLVGLPLSKFRKCWPQIKVCFRPIDGSTQLEHPRLAIERRKQAEFNEKLAGGGRLGAERRWGHRGKKAIGTPSPEDSHPIATPLGPPIGQTCVSSLQSPIPPNPQGGNGGAIPSEVVANRAASFLERYSELFRQHRHGAVYPLKPARDWHYAVQLVNTYPDDLWLDKLATVYLLRDDRDVAGKTRTVGQFASVAPWCDAELRKNGYQPGTAA